MSCWTACTQGSRDQTVVRPSSPAVNDLLTTEGARQRVRVENAAPARREHRSDRGVGDIIRERHQPARQTRRTRRRLYRDHVLNPTSAGCYQLLRCRHSIHSVAVSPSPSMASSSLKSVSSSECAATVIRARSRSSLVLSTVVSLFLRSVATRPFMNGESCIGRLETTPLTTSPCGGDGATFRVRHTRWVRCVRSTNSRNGDDFGVTPSFWPRATRQASCRRSSSPAQRHTRHSLR